MVKGFLKVNPIGHTYTKHKYLQTATFSRFWNSVISLDYGIEQPAVHYNIGGVPRTKVSDISLAIPMVIHSNFYQSSWR